MAGERKYVFVIHHFVGGSINCPKWWLSEWAKYEMGNADVLRHGVPRYPFAAHKRDTCACCK